MTSPTHKAIRHRDTQPRKLRTRPRRQYSASSARYCAPPSALAQWLYRHFYSTARKRFTTHRVVKFLSIGLCCACILTTCTVPHMAARTNSTVVLARHISKGTVIHSSDLRTVPLTLRVNHNALVTSRSSIVGKTSAIDLEANCPIPKSALHNATAVPVSYTSIDVRLASSSATLTRGQHITLITARLDSQENQYDTSTTLARDAIVTDIPHQKAHAQFWEGESSTSTSAGTHITVAMPAQDAMRVLTVQSDSPIIAVSTATHVDK
ncbi:SAF domain-containing protein [Alloscardovia venturai]|uniref:SAF domain-containing protein n=1 Tax=Alloscardovia venturai TaxID=1769421 RepID=A0ABW2Y4B9_9BIFI